MILTVKKTYEVLCEVGLVSQRSHWSHSIWQSPWTVQKRREMSGDLASCAYLLLRLIKHSQQVLRCSWLHFLELNNIQLSFLLKASGDKHSHSSIWRHLFRLIIPAWTFYLPHIQQHRFWQSSSKFCPWWVPLKIRDRQTLRKINIPALMSSFNLFREYGPSAVLSKLETLQHSCGTMVSNQKMPGCSLHTHCVCQRAFKEAIYPFIAEGWLQSQSALEKESCSEQWNTEYLPVPNSAHLYCISHKPGWCDFKDLKKYPEVQCIYQVFHRISLFSQLFGIFLA